MISFRSRSLSRTLGVFLLLPLVTLFLGGCASTHRTALAPAAQSQLKSVGITAVAAHPEIAADIVGSNVAAATGGGLLFALVDMTIEAKRAKKAESTITPVRDALVDFRAPEVLRIAFADEFKAESSLPVTAVTLADVMEDGAVRKYVAAQSTDAVLLVSVDYRFSPTFDQIRVLARARLIPRNGGAADGLQPVFQNDYATYRILPVARADKPEDTAKIWAEKNGAYAREALGACFAELAAMVKYDLKQGPEANLLAKETLTASAPPAGSNGVVRGVVFRGAVAKHEGTRNWVRLQTGELSSTE